jgi:hypothetical protein
MSHAEIDFAALAAEQQQAAEAAQVCYEKTIREACLRLGVTGGNVDDVLKTGVLTLNGVELILISGSIADPWFLQIITDVGEPPEGLSAEAFYKGLLLANLTMVGGHGVFSLSPANGRGILLRCLSMRDESFTAEFLADYLQQITLLDNKNQGNSLASGQAQAGAIFV